MAGTKGNSGRPRKPTYIKLVTGTARKHRENKLEPKPEIKQLEPPEGLHKDVEKEFRKIAKITFNMGVSSEWDIIALEICALAVTAYKHAEMVLIEHGADIKYKTEDGQELITKRVEVSWAEGAFRRASSMLAKFGVSPADRSRVIVINPKRI